MSYRERQIWVVEQNGVVVCGVGMRMDRNSAECKVENEMRRTCPGSWTARPATQNEINPPAWAEPICEE